MTTTITISVMSDVCDPRGLLAENEDTGCAAATDGFVAIVVPVIGLFDDTNGEADADTDAGPDEIRSLTFIVCGCEEPPAEKLVAGFDAGMAEATDVAAPAAGKVVAAGDADETGEAILAPSIFFNVSSTSVACQPAPTSAAFTASREIPSFVCVFI
jgi:hypothetical protein